MADEMAAPTEPETEPETETTAPKHEIGTPRCAVCGKDTRQPITIRLWDNDLDDELEAWVCSGDCAKAWIDGDWAEDDEEPTPLFAEGDEATHPGWARDVEIAPVQSITYTAHAATDPQTVTALDELARAAYAHFTSRQATEQAEPVAEHDAAEGEPQS